MHIISSDTTIEIITYSMCKFVPHEVMIYSTMLTEMARLFVE